jgi:hypothetical protein
MGLRCAPRSTPDGTIQSDVFAADHMERWTNAQLARLQERPCHAIAVQPDCPPEESTDLWEHAIVRARAEIRDLIESGDLSHDEITASWIEAWAASLLTEEHEAV